MNSLSLKINVQNNSLVPTQEQKEQINSFLFGKSSCYVTFAKEKKPRSLNQNSYYHKCIVAPIADYMGEDAKTTHEILKERFVEPQWRNIKGVDYALEKSTARLSTTEMEKYLFNIRRWAQEFLGLTLLLPNESLDYD